VRNHRHRRSEGQARGVAQAALENEPDASPPRARRRRAASRARRRPRPPPPFDHRLGHRAAAAFQRGRQRGGGVQRRDLQLPGPHSRAVGARARVPHEERHRGDRARLGSLGRSLRRALPRHVRVRALGPQSGDAVPRAGSTRREAALLCGAGRRPYRLRLGAEIPCRPPRPRARARPARDRGLLRLRLHPRAAHRLQDGTQARAGAHAHGAARRARGCAAARPTPRPSWSSACANPCACA
jgi:hypothetical protein